MEIYLHDFTLAFSSNSIHESNNIYSVPLDLYSVTEPKAILIPNTDGDEDLWYIFAFKTHYPTLCERYVTYKLNITAS